MYQDALRNFDYQRNYLKMREIIKLGKQEVFFGENKDHNQLVQSRYQALDIKFKDRSQTEQKQIMLDEFDREYTLAGKMEQLSKRKKSNKKGPDKNQIKKLAGRMSRVPGVLGIVKNFESVKDAYNKEYYSKEFLYDQD